MKILVVKCYTYLFLLVLINGFIQPIHMFTNEISEYNIKQVKLMKIGFNNVFWDFVHSNDLKSFNVSSSCIKSLNNVHNSMNKANEWPLKMFDSSSRFIFDSTETGYYDFGNYDECLSLQWIDDVTKKSESGQHCTISMLPKILESEYSTNLFTRHKIISQYYEAVFKIGICIPSSCYKDDIQTIFSKAIDSYDWQFIKIDQCKIKTTLAGNVLNAARYQKLSLAFLTAIVVVNLYATLLDWLMKFNLSNETQIQHNNGWIRHFSLIRNFNGFINPVSTSRMTFLTKFQITVHSSVIMVHVFVLFYISKGIGLFANSSSLIKNRNSFLVKSGISDWSSCGIFVYGSIARTMEYWKITGPSTPLISSFRNMFIKMITIVMISLPLVAFTFVTPLFFGGPAMSISSGFLAEACSRSFYANVLFLQNTYRPIAEICLPHTWSVAVEFQILPVIIILVHLYKRYPKLAVILNSSIVIAGLLYTGIDAFIKDSHPHIASRSLNIRYILYWFENVYFPTYMNIWIYTIPPLWTYIIMNKYEKSNKILIKFTRYSKLFTVILVVLHILPAIWVFLESYVHGPSLSAIYFIFYRLCTAALYTFVFMCNSDQLRDFFTHPLDKDIFIGNSASINNHSNNELSSERMVDQSIQTDKDKSVKVEKIPREQKHRLLQFISTLWRSAYYVHINIMILIYSIQRWPLNSIGSYISIIIEFLGFTLLAAFFFHLFVVGPVINLIATVKFKSQLKSKSK